MTKNRAKTCKKGSKTLKNDQKSCKNPQKRLKNPKNQARPRTTRPGRARFLLETRKIAVFAKNDQKKSYITPYLQNPKNPKNSENRKKTRQGTVLFRKIGQNRRFNPVFRYTIPFFRVFLGQKRLKMGHFPPFSAIFRQKRLKTAKNAQF